MEPEFDLHIKAFAQFLQCQRACVRAHGCEPPQIPVPLVGKTFGVTALMVKVSAVTRAVTLEGAAR